MEQPQPYLSFLLRLWRSGKGQQAAWRASLESPLTGERRGFASLPELVAFLEAVIGAASQGSEGQNPQAAQGKTNDET